MCDGSIVSMMIPNVKRQNLIVIKYCSFPSAEFIWIHLLNCSLFYNFWWNGFGCFPLALFLVGVSTPFRLLGKKICLPVSKLPYVDAHECQCNQWMCGPQFTNIRYISPASPLDPLFWNLREHCRHSILVSFSFLCPFVQHCFLWN